MRREDVIELIRVDMPDYTDGAFDIKLESDDGGTHIVIRIDDHENSQKILRELSCRFKSHRIIIMLVSKGSLS